MLRIRLQRFGKKRAPIYRIVVIEKAQKRNGKPVEVLGFYNPLNKELVYNVERVNYWKGVGAIPSETAKFVLSNDPIHDLAKGPYQYKAKSRADKEKARVELLKKSTKNTKAKKKAAEAAAKPKEEPAAEEAPAEAATEEAAAS